MRIFLLCTVVAGLGMLAACDPISEEQCQIGDWAGLGLKDGQAGRPLSRLNDYAEICSAIGITPDTRAYSNARNVGLQSFCTPQNAYSVGRAGNSIGNVCPPLAMPQLTAANTHGLTYHEYQDQIDSAERRIDDYQDRLRELSKLGTENAKAEMSHVRSDIRDKERDIRRLERRQDRYAYWP